MKAFKAFIKTFKAPQRSVKIKIELNFFSLRPGLGQGYFLKCATGSTYYLKKIILVLQ